MKSCWGHKMTSRPAEQMLVGGDNSIYSEQTQQAKHLYFGFKEHCSKILVLEALQTY